MTAVRVLVDETLCTSSGVCEVRAPEVFAVEDDGAMRVLQDPVAEDGVAAARDAVRSCPTRALRLAPR